MGQRTTKLRRVNFVEYDFRRAEISRYGKTTIMMQEITMQTYSVRVEGVTENRPDLT